MTVRSLTTTPAASATTRNVSWYSSPHARAPSRTIPPSRFLPSRVAGSGESVTQVLAGTPHSRVTPAASLATSVSELVTTSFFDTFFQIAETVIGDFSEVPSTST